MARYTIVPRTSPPGFDVAVEGANGARQSMLGFATEADAQAWITQDQRLSEAADPFAPSARRH